MDQHWKLCFFFRLASSLGDASWVTRPGSVWEECTPHAHWLNGVQKSEKCRSVVWNWHAYVHECLSSLHSGHSSAAVFFHHLSIGAIISLFCDGLKEQIESRVYFYKNSKLVSYIFPHEYTYNTEWVDPSLLIKYFAVVVATIFWAIGICRCCIMKQYKYHLQSNEPKPKTIVIVYKSICTVEVC